MTDTVLAALRQQRKAAAKEVARLDKTIKAYQNGQARAGSPQHWTQRPGAAKRLSAMTKKAWSKRRNMLDKATENAVSSQPSLSQES